MSLNQLITNEEDDFQWAREIALHFQDEENMRITIKIEIFVSNYHVTKTIMPSLHA